MYTFTPPILSYYKSINDDILPYIIKENRVGALVRVLCDGICKWLDFRRSFLTALITG